MCLSSRKISEMQWWWPRKAQNKWQKTTALNKGQILYRIGEMLEGRKEQFINELMQTGSSKLQAKKRLEQSIDRLIYYAG